MDVNCAVSGGHLKGRDWSLVHPMLLGHSFPILARALPQPSWATWVLQYPQETEPTPVLSITVSLTLTSSKPGPTLARSRLLQHLALHRLCLPMIHREKASRPRGSDYRPRSSAEEAEDPVPWWSPFYWHQASAVLSSSHLAQRASGPKQLQTGMGISKGQGKGHWVLPFALWHLFPILCWHDPTQLPISMLCHSIKANNAWFGLVGQVSSRQLQTESCTPRIRQQAQRFPRVTFLAWFCPPPCQLLFQTSCHPADHVPPSLHWPATHCFITSSAGVSQSADSACSGIGYNQQGHSSPLSGFYLLVAPGSSVSSLPFDQAQPSVEQVLASTSPPASPPGPLPPTLNLSFSSGVTSFTSEVPDRLQQGVPLPTGADFTSLSITAFAVALSADKESANWASKPAFDSDEIGMATVPPSQAPPDTLPPEQF